MGNAIGQRYQDKITEAYICLLSASDGRSVTVKTICQEAGVNRSTFYAHFEDISALQSSIVRQTADAFEGAVRQYFQEDKHLGDMAHDRTFQITAELLSISEQYTAIFAIPALRDGVVDIIATEDTEWCLERYRKVHGVVPRKVELEYKMMINGAVKQWADWLGDGCRDSIELIAEVTRKYVTAIVADIWRFDRNALDSQKTEARGEE